MIAAAVALSSCAEGEIPTPTPSEPQISAPYVEGEVIVKFTPQVADMIAQVEATRGAATRSGAVALDEVLEAIEGYELERVFPIDERTEERTREQGLHQWYVVRFGAGCTAEQVAERLQTLGEVQAVDFNRTIKRAYRSKATPLSAKRLAAAESATRATVEAMNDPLLAAQWHLINRGDQFCEGDQIKSVRDADVQCEGAWKRSTGNEQVMAYYERNRQSVERIARWDLLDLQHRLPRWMLQLPYDILNRINRRKLLAAAPEATASIRMEDYRLTDDEEQGFDLFVIATK